ncbi:MAG: thioredoxin family protein [bacterium]|nr:thioredoxin family protein [bacterium]
MRIYPLVLSAVLPFFVLAGAWAAEPESVEEPPMLLGACTEAQLNEEPFSEWYREEYEGYEPNADVVAQLRRADRRGVELTLFFGTWCGDSRHEVPRMVKLLRQAGFSDDDVELIAVDRGEGVHKQSPGGEERGVEIYRVPTLVIRRGGREASRIVEFPVLSLERDLLAILDGEPYEPNYLSYPLIRRWLDEGLLVDENVSARGLAGQARHLIASEGELAAAANVLIERGDVTEGVTLARVNCALHRESARCAARLAEALLRAENHEAAAEAAQRALRLNTDGERVEELVELLSRARK